MFNKFKTKKTQRRVPNAVDSTTTQHVFRRNRTLASYKSGGEHQSSRSHIHRLSIKRRKLSGIFLIVVLSALALFLLIINFTANPLVVVSDTSILKPVNKASYEDKIQSYLKQNPFSRFLFIIDSSKLTNYVASSAPEVASIDYRDMESFGSNNFLVKFRKPVAGWAINDKQYYVDKDGVQFEVNYFDNPKVQITDESGASTAMSSDGSAIASRRFLSFVGQVVSAARDRNYIVIKASLPEDTTRQLEIQIKESQSVIKLSLDRPVGDQIGDMDRAIKYFTRKNLAPKYIDVRVAGRVFY